MKKLRSCTLLALVILCIAVCFAFMSCKDVSNTEDATTVVSDCYGDSVSDTESMTESGLNPETKTETESELNSEETSSVVSENTSEIISEITSEMISDITTESESSDITESTTEQESEKPVEIPLPDIKTSLEDGKVYSGKILTIDVFARDKDGNKISSTVKLNGEPVAVNWDDNEKTSYTLTLREGENTVVICAVANGKNAEKTFHVFYEKAPASFVFSVDAFSIGCGYVVDPTVVKLDDGTIDEIAEFCASEYGCDAEFVKENLNSAHVLAYLLSFYGYELDYTGKLDSGFYLSYIKGFNHEDNIPDNLREILESNGFSVDTAWKQDVLGEFDYTFGSGWMYCVDGVFPNVGFSDHYIQDGEVIRVQFTLSFGAEIGGSGAMGGGSNDWFEDVSAERDRLTALMARARSAGLENRKEYLSAYELISTFGISADNLSNAADSLESVLNG